MILIDVDILLMILLEVGILLMILYITLHSSVSQSSKDDNIEDAGIDRSLIFDQSVECQASIEVGVQVGVSVRCVGIYSSII